jgi:hypothetical protein
VNSSLRPVTMLAAAMFAAFAARPATQGYDEADVRGVATRQADAWNRHDAKAEARWVATLLAAGAVAASVWAGVRIWTTPVRLEVVEATEDGAGANCRFESRRFAEISGLGVLPLAIPVLISGLGAWAAHRRRRWGVVAAALALAIFTFVTGFSIGSAYLPAVCGLVLAGVVELVNPYPPGSQVSGAA